VSEESISDVASGSGGGGGGGGKGGKTKGKGAAGGAAAVGPVEVQLYSRGGGGLCARGWGGGRGGGGCLTLGSDRVVVLSGDIDAVGVVMITESTAAAARAIKQDIAQTLCSRVEMLFEDWALQEEEGVLAASSLPECWRQTREAAWALPRRILFELTGQIRLGQHVVESDGPSEALENLKQMVPDLQVCFFSLFLSFFLSWKTCGR
jgi:hypothetical protein